MRFLRLMGLMFGLAGMLALPQAHGQTNQVVFSYGDFLQLPQVGRKIFLYPLMLPSVNSAGISTIDRWVLSTRWDTGLAIATNMLPGLYRGEFQGTWRTTTNWFTIPTNSGTIYASNCIANAYVLAGSTIPAYSMPQSDARFAPIGSVGGGGGAVIDPSSTMGLRVLPGIAVLGETNSSQLSVINQNGFQQVILNGTLPAYSISGWSGDGSGLTKINSNCLDSATAAQLALAGTGGGSNAVTESSINPSWDASHLTFGSEYLYHWFSLLRSNLAATVVFDGDSTTSGTSITDSRYLLQNIVPSAMGSVYSTITWNNVGVSGKDCVWWATNAVNTELAANPDLLIVRFGMNGPQNGSGVPLASLASSVSSALATLRASRSVANLSIIVMMPNPSGDTANGRTPAFFQALEPIFRSAARQYQCAFMDTYTFLKDATNANNLWMDSPPVHPKEEMNLQIGSWIADFICPLSIRNTVQNSYLTTQSVGPAIQASLTANSIGLQDLSYGQFPTCYATLPPTWYTKWISSYRAASSAGWPIDGQVTTIHEVDGVWLQINSGYNSATIAMRCGGASAGWFAWQTNGVSGGGGGGTNIVQMTIAQLNALMASNSIALRNVAASVESISPTNAPSYFTNFLSTYRADGSLGWPADGQVTTIHELDGVWYQLNTHYYLPFQVSRCGGNGGWQAWQTNLTSANILSLLGTNGNAGTYLNGAGVFSALSGNGGGLTNVNVQVVGTTNSVDGSGTMTVKRLIDLVTILTGDVNGNGYRLGSLSIGGTYSGSGAGVSNLNAIYITATNAPGAGNALRFNGTSFYWGN